MKLSIDIHHYLASLERKPGALRNIETLKSIPLLKAIFDHHYSKNPRKFIEILIEIITTNLTYKRWEEIFKDYHLTGAIVDSLSHRVHILDLSREISYRMEDMILWGQSL